MDTAIDLSDASKALDLANIRFQLMWGFVGFNTQCRSQNWETDIYYLSRLEDTITFHLIERVQFPLNPTIYKPGGVKIPNSSLSLFDWMLREQERFQSLVRRYESPDEYPFFPDAVEKPILQPLEYPKILHENDVDVNQAIKEKYIEEVLPRVCRQFGREDRGEKQENYGSAATCDVNCLQALSRRIHFGKFVAESKFQQETQRFVDLIKAGDRDGIDAAITNATVEKTVLERLKLKARTYGTDPSIGGESEVKINVDAVVSMYEVSHSRSTSAWDCMIVSDTARELLYLWQKSSKSSI